MRLPSLRRLPAGLARRLAGAWLLGGLLPGIASASTLDYWNFSDTNWLSGLSYPPMSFTNLASSGLGEGNAVVLDSTNAAWLQYRVVETNGAATNLTVDQGSILFWFAPTSWSGTNAGGAGPGNWSRLVEAGCYTTNASYGWFSL